MPRGRLWKDFHSGKCGGPSVLPNVFTVDQPAAAQVKRALRHAKVQMHGLQSHVQDESEFEVARIAPQKAGKK